MHELRLQEKVNKVKKVWQFWREERTGEGRRHRIKWKPNDRIKDNKRTTSRKWVKKRNYMIIYFIKKRKSRFVVKVIEIRFVDHYYTLLLIHVLPLIIMSSEFDLHCCSRWNNSLEITQQVVTSINLISINLIQKMLGRLCIITLKEKIKDKANRLQSESEKKK